MVTAKIRIRPNTARQRLKGEVKIPFMEFVRYTDPPMMHARENKIENKHPGTDHLFWGN